MVRRAYFVPWKETAPLNERTRFIALWQEDLYTMTELCERFQISRRTGYKWLARYESAGFAGLQDQSRAPHQRPRRTDAAVEQVLLETRRAHPTWGPRKILPYLRKRRPDLVLPAASTAGDLFQRHGLVHARPKRRPATRKEAPALQTTAPNEVWCADFKGDFRLGSGDRCYPLTITDAHSRFLLLCRSLPSTGSPAVQESFAVLFHACGLPAAIRTDNGVPFVSQAPLGLSRLSVWWLKLGIQHQRIAPGQPAQNGRHERMHRTLKAETTRPPAGDWSAQQERFDAFQHEYNQERPHEALGQEPPAQHYRPSSRPLPDRLPEPDYPAYYEQRKVHETGRIKFRGQYLFLSEVLVGERVGLAETQDGVWSIYFYEHLLARWDERTTRTSG